MLLRTCEATGRDGHALARMFVHLVWNSDLLEQTWAMMASAPVARSRVLLPPMLAPISSNAPGRSLLSGALLSSAAGGAAQEET